jgi:hypothetical protein
MPTANEPLAGPVAVVGIAPGKLGNDGGRASQIRPKSVSVVVGGPMDAPTTGLAGPPGTAVRLGAGDDEDGREDGLADGPQAPMTNVTRTARTAARLGTGTAVARRRGAVTGSC